MSQPQIEILSDPAALAARAADLLEQTAAASIGARGRFRVALSGGSTPEKMHQDIAARVANGKVDWSRTEIFFGDERMVPPDDPRSNYGMARRSLLEHVPIPAENVFPVPVHDESDVAALEYDRILRKHFDAESQPPILDLIFLGLGDDGHTASLFPGMPSLAVQDLWAVGSPPGVLPPPVHRVTVTFPILNAARNVVFLVAGGAKAQIVQEVLDLNAAVEAHPAVGVKPQNGRLIWLLDEPAAALLFINRR